MAGVIEPSPTRAMRLRGAGLRPTAIRLAVLDTLQAMPHAGVPEIALAVDQALGTASRQAVYNALDQLLLSQLVRRIEPSGSPARYESRVGDNHHHVICRSCGAIDDVDCAVDYTPCLSASDDHGYVIDEAEVIYWGICPTCLTPAPPKSTRNRTMKSR